MNDYIVFIDMNDKVRAIVDIHDGSQRAALEATGNKILGLVAFKSKQHAIDYCEEVLHNG